MTVWYLTAVGLAVAAALCFALDRALRRRRRRRHEQYLRDAGHL